MKLIFLSALDFKTRETIIVVTQCFALRFQYNLYSMEETLDTCKYDMPKVYWPHQYMSIGFKHGTNITTTENRFFNMFAQFFFLRGVENKITNKGIFYQVLSKAHFRKDTKPHDINFFSFPEFNQ